MSLYWFWYFCTSHQGNEQLWANPLHFCVSFMFTHHLTWWPHLAPCYNAKLFIKCCANWSRFVGREVFEVFFRKCTIEENSKLSWFDFDARFNGSVMAFNSVLITVVPPSGCHVEMQYIQWDHVLMPTIKMWWVLTKGQCDFEESKHGHVPSPGGCAV